MYICKVEHVFNGQIAGREVGVGVRRNAGELRLMQSTDCNHMFMCSGEVVHCGILGTGMSFPNSAFSTAFELFATYLSGAELLNF